MTVYKDRNVYESIRNCIHGHLSGEDILRLTELIKNRKISEEERASIIDERITKLQARVNELEDLLAKIATYAKRKQPKGE